MSFGERQRWQRISGTEEELTLLKHRAEAAGIRVHWAPNCLFAMPEDGVPMELLVEAGRAKELEGNR